MVRIAAESLAGVVFMCLILVCCAVKDVVTGYDRERVACPFKSLVFGPGLETNFVVPARFFYIQAVDFENNNFTYSPGSNAFEVSIKPIDGNRGRIYLQMLDRHDGTFIVRYRLYQSYDGLKITVKSAGRHVADSPYKLNGLVKCENCYCPVEDRNQWRSNMFCRPDVHSQTQIDFSIFPSIDLSTLHKNVESRFARHHSLCHYAIIDNKVYRKTLGSIVGFKMFSDAFLLSLTRKVKVPDVEFFINLGDWPLEKKDPEDGPLPILSWCGSTDTRDIVLPTYDITESTLESMGRVSLDMLSVQANTGPKWENKTEKAFWRGRDSRRERLNLVKLSRRRPELLDAALTNFFFFRNEEAEFGPKVKHVSFYDFFNFKYQINVDGTVAAYRLPYLLAGDSTVFKHDSIYYEHFYAELEPWVHYIPFKQDLSDLEERIEWAMQNDESARTIAENGKNYVRENLTSNNVYCYYLKVLEEYASRQVGEPRIHEGMELVEHPSENSGCDCPNQSTRHTEL
ncbi:protein O-glucosyltransferase 2-like [Lytechinus variegatus]|uniref:protein O-glucosyltransferase 2-like n=1 Tax=Lytechinus variegatus TaxID=7654 RepID=UPI001BB21B71|nr:protein O-glucosyltransferase 2-like [Lytechinus variegatus]